MAIPTDTTGFGKMTIKKLETCLIESSFDTDNIGAATTDGDFVLKVNNGDTNPVSFATTKFTFHYDAAVPTLTFESNTRLINIADPTANQHGATKKYVDDMTSGRFLIDLTGNALRTKSGTNQTWTTAELLSGMIIRNTTADSVDVLPTAEAMIGAISNAEDGTSINLVVQKTGTHRVTFTANSGSSAEGHFRIGAGTSSTSVFAPALENLRTTVLRIIVRNATPGALVCELALISDR